MREIIDVNTGEVFVGNGTLTLRALAIGSCIVIAAYDLKTKNAGMAHIMLPDTAPEKFREKTKYASKWHRTDAESDDRNRLSYR